MKKNFLIINSFALKLIAFLLMTLDHVGIFMMASPDSTLVSIGTAFRLLGRLAFPLFVMMLVEGVRHTRSFPKYALRLGIVATIVLIAQIIIYYYVDNSVGSAYSPLLDLLCYGTILYLLSRKDKWSILAIIPLALVIGSFVIELFEAHTAYTVKWFPPFFRSGYSIFGLMMALIMYFGYPLLKKFFIQFNMDVEDYEKGHLFRFYLNVIYAFGVIFSTIVVYLIAKIPNSDPFGVNNVGFSLTWAIASIIIILLYNGERGYDSRWFRVASYLYFPVHLVIIYFVFYIINIF